MALQKNEDFNGITCNYWKILRIMPDYVLNSTTAILGLYLDSSTRGADVDNVVDMIKISASGLHETRLDMYPLCTAAGAYLEGASDV